MKKSYNKPDIMFDNFTMSERVANCEVKANFLTGICGVEMAPDLIIFTNGVAKCNVFYKDEELNGLCYHVPYDMNNVFGS